MLERTGASVGPGSSRWAWDLPVALEDALRGHAAAPRFSVSVAEVIRDLDW